MQNAKRQDTLENKHRAQQFSIDRLVATLRWKQQQLASPLNLLFFSGIFNEAHHLLNSYQVLTVASKECSEIVKRVALNLIQCHLTDIEG